MGAGPGPLEVVAAQPAGDVHHLANAVQAGLGLGFHGLLRERARVHATQRHLGLLVALGACGHQLPARQALGQQVQRLVAGFVDGALPLRLLCRPGVGQTAGHEGREFVGDQLARARFGLQQRRGQVHARCQVDRQGLAGLPVA